MGVVGVGVGVGVGRTGVVDGNGVGVGVGVVVGSSSGGSWECYAIQWGMEGIDWGLGRRSNVVFSSIPLCMYPVF